jgi:hypothetical protein
MRNTAKKRKMYPTIKSSWKNQIRRFLLFRQYFYCCNAPCGLFLNHWNAGYSEAGDVKFVAIHVYFITCAVFTGRCGWN